MVVYIVRVLSQRVPTLYPFDMLVSGSVPDQPATSSRFDINVHQHGIIFGWNFHGIPST